jgi:predicted dehydrogenase
MAYRCGIIGCGGIARCHAQAYRNDARMELVAGAERDPERAQKFGTAWEIPVYPSLEEMLGRERLDVVSICTPHPAHYQPVLQAARSGARAIVCEKPLGLNLAEADEMVRVAREHGVLLIVDHQRRFQPVHLATAGPARRGELGKLTDIHFEIPYWDLMSWGTHALDLIRFYNHDEPAVSVFGQVDLSTIHQRFGQRVENGFLAHIRFANDTTATFTGGPHIKLFHQRLIGEEGELFWEEIWGDPPVYTIRVRRHGEAAWREIPRPENDEWQTGFDGAIRALADSLDTGCPHTLEAASAREGLAIVMAIYESARTHRVIHFPVDIPYNPLERMLDAM